MGGVSLSSIASCADRVTGNVYITVITIGNSRITFHHFIFRELFLVIISSWLTSKHSGRIISRNLSD